MIPVAGRLLSRMIASACWEHPGESGEFKAGVRSFKVCKRGLVVIEAYRTFRDRYKTKEHTQVRVNRGSSTQARKMQNPTRCPTPQSPNTMGPPSRLTQRN
jgi:hypothetical protein